MGSCQCMQNNPQDTQSNIPVAYPDNNGNTIKIKYKDDKMVSEKEIPQIVTDLVKLPSKKIKDDNDISEFIKPTQISP